MPGPSFSIPLDVEDYNQELKLALMDVLTEFASGICDGLEEYAGSEGTLTPENVLALAQELAPRVFPKPTNVSFNQETQQLAVDKQHLISWDICTIAKLFGGTVTDHGDVHVVINVDGKLDVLYRRHILTNPVSGERIVWSQNVEGNITLFETIGELFDDWNNQYGGPLGSPC